MPYKVSLEVTSWYNKLPTWIVPSGNPLDVGGVGVFDVVATGRAGDCVAGASVGVAGVGAIGAVGVAGVVAGVVAGAVATGAAGAVAVTVPVATGGAGL